MSTCAAPDCYRTTRHGEYCETHQKRLQRGAALAPPIASRSTPWETLTEAAIRYADVEPDDDSEFSRAKDVLRKAASSYSQQAHRKAVEEGRKAARARGVRFGRPPRMLPDEAAREVMKHGSVRAAARVLGMHRRNLQRLLAKACSCDPNPFQCGAGCDCGGCGHASKQPHIKVG